VEKRNPGIISQSNPHIAWLCIPPWLTRRITRRFLQKETFLRLLPEMGLQTRNPFDNVDLNAVFSVGARGTEGNEFTAAKLFWLN